MGKISLAILSIIASVYVSYFAAEHLFFDKFFYQKSAVHGYMDYSSADLSKLGERASDVVWIQNEMKQFPQSGIKDDSSFNVAVIGDSVAWGQGIKNSERFPVLLERELSKIRKTNVYSFALPGDNFTQNYEKIKFLESIQDSYKIDLYILALGHNDALVTVSDRYQSGLSDPLLEECKRSSQLIYDAYVSPTDTVNDYNKNVENALNNPGNLCVIHKIISSLPKNLVVLETDNNFTDDIFHEKYGEIFSKYGFRLLTPAAYFKNTWDPFNLYPKTVSGSDGHPSKYANTIFAKILYEEITKSQEFKLKQSKTN